MIFQHMALVGKRVSKRPVEIKNLNTHLFDAAFRSSTSSNSSSPESHYPPPEDPSPFSLSPSCISTSSPSTAAAAATFAFAFTFVFVFVLPFALVVDLDSLVSALERREVALEELATGVGVSSDGGGDVEGAELKLRDGASEIRKDGNGLSHKAQMT